MPRGHSIAERFADWDLDEESRTYLAFHRRRYTGLLDDVERARREAVAASAEAPLRILDIGPSFETQLLRDSYPAAVVDTLGFRAPQLEPRPGERHVEFDLNLANGSASRPDVEPHDVVILAEVIEHLYTAPEDVLSLVGSWMKPSGRLLLQTPNAVALHQRVKLLIGRNPSEPIRRSRTNPGHFHEYTIGELRAAAGSAGLEIAWWAARNHFELGGAAGAFYRVAGPLIPASLRQGLTLCLRHAVPPRAGDHLGSVARPVA